MRPPIWVPSFDEVTAIALFGGFDTSGQALVENHFRHVEASHSQGADLARKIVLVNGQSATRGFEKLLLPLDASI